MPDATDNHMTVPTAKHFIIIRFFPRQNLNYLYNVLHVGFLKKQAALAVNNSLRSLENQTNKDFEVIFLLNGRLFVDENYKFVFDTLRGGISVPVHFPQNYNSFIKDAYDKYDFVIQSKMDLDDFLHKDAVADTQSKIGECENVLIYGYCKGYLYLADKNVFLDRYSKDYSYTKGTLSHIYYSSRGIGHLGILQSFICKSSFAKTLPTMGPYAFIHHKAKLKFQAFLEKNGVAFSESMFQQNTTMNAFIYFRHEFSHFILAHEGAADTWIEDRDEVTTEEITKKQLEDEFGFFYELNSIE